MVCKRDNIFILLFIFALQLLYGQKSLILQPSGLEGQDALIDSLNPDLNYGQAEDLTIMNWQKEGRKGVTRALLNFNLSQLPPDALILSAKITFTSQISLTFGGSAIDDQSSETWIRRITSPWTESTVTWNNQPKTTRQNEVQMRSNNFLVEVFPNVDITGLITDAFKDQENSFGIQIRLVEEDSPNRRLVLASSDVLSKNSQPRLVILYDVPIALDSCLVFLPPYNSPNSTVINTSMPDVSLYPRPDISTRADDNDEKEPFIEESFFKFDLDKLPESIDISKAYLTLRNNANNSRDGHSTFSGSNASLLKRVTEPWDASSVTWSNQPSTTDLNAIELDRSAVPYQDYINIDVTPLVKDAYAEGEENYGFHLSLIDHDPFRALRFASSHHEEANKRSHLTVCYNPCSELIGADLSAFLQTEYEQNISLPITYFGNVTSYTWAPQEGLSCYNCSHPQIINRTVPEYTLALENDIGCKRILKVPMVFQPKALLFPNIISMANPILYGSGEEGISYELVVYDRWGGVHYRSKGLMSNDRTQGWKIDERISPGVYIYQVNQNNGVTLVGDITVYK